MTHDTLQLTDLFIFPWSYSPHTLRDLLVSCMWNLSMKVESGDYSASGEIIYSTDSIQIIEFIKVVTVLTAGAVV